MPLPVSFQAFGTVQADAAERASRPSSLSSPSSQTEKSDSGQRSDIGQRFEQMLWTEMLTYAGLDKAFSQGGGEAASAFSRYVVEAIAKDLAETHPMGLAEAVDRTVASAQTPVKAPVRNETP